MKNLDTEIFRLFFRVDVLSDNVPDLELVLRFILDGKPVVAMQRTTEPEPRACMIRLEENRQSCRLPARRGRTTCEHHAGHEHDFEYKGPDYKRHTLALWTYVPVSGRENITKLPVSLPADAVLGAVRDFVNGVENEHGYDHKRCFRVTHDERSIMVTPVFEYVSK